MSRNKKQGRWLLEFYDETSAFDPKGAYNYGSDCYMRWFSAWIPNAIKKTDADSQLAYLDRHPQAYRN